MDLTQKKTINGIIDIASPHTIKKFELIEKYVETWAQKLLQYDYCKSIIFIDCMSNCGEYIDDNNRQVFGTPVRVAKYLNSISGQYPQKQINLYLNDYSSEKTNHLKTLLPQENENFHYIISTQDGNQLLKQLSKTLSNTEGTHFLLVYDPYEATIDWKAIMPFLNAWGEVIINHMVSDSIRALKVVKSASAKSKYEQTYLTSIENLIPFGSDKIAYEKRIETIIKALNQDNSRNIFISAFPFFNEKNAILYNLIHCTKNIEGFKLYKKSAWQTFGGKSSTKDTHGQEDQLMFDFDGTGNIKANKDEFCYDIKDIAEYLNSIFRGKANVPLVTLWDLLDKHPIFPSDGFKTQIKAELKQNYGAIETKGKISFGNQ